MVKVWEFLEIFIVNMQVSVRIWTVIILSKLVSIMVAMNTQVISPLPRFKLECA